MSAQELEQQSIQPVSPPRRLKRRPLKMEGVTYKTETPVGQLFLTVNRDKDDVPLEVFMRVGKAGSDVSTMAEALGRLISLILRFEMDTPPEERIRILARELKGIGGVRSVGFGEEKIHSLPDAVAKVLDKHVDKIEEQEDTVATGTEKSS